MDRGQEWDLAPSGLLVLRADGTVLDANTTVLGWVGRRHREVAGRLRLSELLTVGGRIYWETHLSLMLHAEGRVEEVAVELKVPAGRLPVLMTAVAETPAAGGPVTVRVVLSGARERSRYERELLAARQVADRSAARTKVLQEITSALSGAAGLDGVVGALLSATGSLGADAATLWSADPEEGLIAYASAGESLGACPRPATGPYPGAATIDRGRVVVPLHGQSAPQGLLSMVPSRGPGADPVDMDVLTAVGQQAGLALDRARLYEQSAGVARQLQRSLLATTMPADERFSLSTDYRPGVAALEVGGDWYDAFLTRPGVLAVVVGDVVGRGLGAATAMGQLRSAVRAVAGPGVGPAEVLSHLDRFAQQTDGAAYTTLAYAEIHLSTGRVSYSCAGHMPPLLVPADGGPRLLWDGRSTPLALVPPDGQRAVAEVLLSPGDQLLLYTDGLVERHDRPLAEGFAALTQHAEALRAVPPQHGLQELSTSLLCGVDWHDDVCAMLLSWHGTAVESAVTPG
ncbi:SpoIIE family protein phosphatase [Georgenia sp. 10Sc9-8]|uniref:SpoIIE family protein phosphatase n=1 Tax=Georgenia halotolerans TaxID=3028317 RepID=A0ABT5U042_9MICO|nr:SpoIIE family protein phosphatase [Georgenia halotolerans]